jgi:hypothetical protein
MRGFSARWRRSHPDAWDLKRDLDPRSRSCRARAWPSLQGSEGGASCAGLREPAEAPPPPIPKLAAAERRLRLGAPIELVWDFDRGLHRRFFHITIETCLCHRSLGIDEHSGLPAAVERRAGRRTPNSGPVGRLGDRKRLMAKRSLSLRSGSGRLQADLFYCHSRRYRIRDEANLVGFMVQTLQPALLWS